MSDIFCRPLPFLILLVVSCAGCQPGPPSDKSAGDGEWGGPAALEEQLRIGVLESDEEAYMLGRIQELTPDGHGGVFVFDGAVPAIRHFDATGTYTHTVGGKGSGPGEYQDVLLGMHVLSNGNLIVRDPRNRRFTIYDPEGAPVDQWPLDSGLYTARAMYVDREGSVYARITTNLPVPDAPFEIALLRYQGGGSKIDTVEAPVMDREPPEGNSYFSVSTTWDLHPDGYMIVGISDSYTIELRKPEGTVVLTRPLERVPVKGEERSEWEARRAWTNENQGQFMPTPLGPVPELKPMYRNIYAGSDGSVWVRRYVEAEKVQPDPAEAPPAADAPPQLTWREPAVYDVFRDDGTFLGEVHVPSGVSLYTYNLETVWATTTGEQGETIVVKYAVKPS